MNDIKVVWHKIPDTDCTLAAIILANYFNKKRVYSATPYIQWKLNKETEFLLNLLDIETPEIARNFTKWTSVALVDHNESSQTLDNLNELEIEYIIDHHKIDFSTSTPINIRMEKLCSTCSILYKMYKADSIEIDEKTWKMILAWILSDSLLFKSATTTKEDVEIANELKEITGITDFEAFAMPMFDAKSDLWDISVEDLIKYDYKEFELNWTKTGIWTLETTNPGYALWRKEEILEWMKKIKKDDNLSFILLSVVDIIWEKNTSIVLDWADSKIVETVFWEKVHYNLVNLKRRLSRKKQIVPDLIEYFN